MQTNRQVTSNLKNVPATHAMAQQPELLNHRLFEASFSTDHQELICKMDPGFKTTAAPMQTTHAKPPSLVAGLRALLTELGLFRKISVALSGFAGNPAKVYLAEIGVVPTTEGYYNLHLGGNPETKTLNRIYKYNLPESSVLSELAGLLLLFKVKAKTGERFGDFVTRTQLI